MIRFFRSLHLWNLGADHSSRLGCHEAISTCDHEACQWFGLRLRDAMCMVDPRNRPDGFVYPSHRVKGFLALALVDWAASALFSKAHVDLYKYVETDVYQYLKRDPMCTAAPDQDFS